MHRMPVRLAYVAVVAALAGCGVTPLATSPPGPTSLVAPASPSAAPSTSDLPEPTASTTPSGSSSGLAEETRPIFENWALATVRVNGLNVRSEPGTDAPLVPDEYGQFGEGGLRLNEGNHVLVLSDARSADGLWWLTIGVNRVGVFNPVVVGWAAAGTREDPWIEEDNAWCPSDPSLDVLLTLSGIERMGCYASAPITIDAYQATRSPDAGLGGACRAREPAWLLCDNINYNWVNRDGGYDWEFLLHFDPATGISATDVAPEGTRRKLLITGHFWDAAASDCADSPLVAADDQAAFLNCAVQFVVERLEDA